MLILLINDNAFLIIKIKLKILHNNVFIIILCMCYQTVVIHVECINSLQGSRIC